MPEQGWIKLHRKITECGIWRDKPYDRAHAWVDILLMANHEGKRFLHGNEMVYIERGSKLTSIRKLGERWGWSNNKVTAFLKLLQSENMLVQNSDTKKTVLTVVNYDLYQSTQETEETPTEHERDTKETRLHTNKNDKNVKNDKKINNTIPKTQYAESVALTEVEYLKLVAEHGEQDTKRMIEILSNYKLSSGKKYKSDYHAILNWVVKRLAEEKQRTPRVDKPSGQQIKSPALNGTDKYEQFYL